MPTLEFGASCDICTERYDRGQRAPCSIKCGHMYCSDCLRQIIAAQKPHLKCPFCRASFTAGSVVRLRIDIDDVEPVPPAPPEPTLIVPPQPNIPATVIEEIERLEEAFGKLGQPQTTSPMEFKRQLRNYITDLWSVLHCTPEDPYLFLHLKYRYDLLQRLSVVSEQLQDAKVGYLLQKLSSGNGNLVEGWIQCLESYLAKSQSQKGSEESLPSPSKPNTLESTPPSNRRLYKPQPAVVRLPGHRLSQSQAIMMILAASQARM
ncbi:hypothetical protein VKT23_003204 [Stygiomarasmius scandens]|uniref:RING-type domain-containing protein n=1 Tax=Marasmiellus scandens TaxID=2682957 RepID=A0ABR1JZ90_9AGAR